MTPAEIDDIAHAFGALLAIAAFVLALYGLALLIPPRKRKDDDDS